ncbi:hypothetical protein [Rhodococcus sp. IEGM 1379]|uniref:hypothetical protein n=1 Tax=Rhodococcus sp. IEGM 1379 TaxID=3047086 RepID=UPI0024B7B1F4|nr:hypothetical protein [Rhodococcus sp. IEGM 1379]MDI9917746.1 hypothetical protein [Rhodococcus sp. IEGM 1379]
MLLGGGSSGSKTDHWASVSDEDGYTAHRCPADAWDGHDGHIDIGDDDIVDSWVRAATCHH